MKHTGLFLLCTLGLHSFLAPHARAQDATAENKKTQEPIVAIQQSFLNLPKKKRDQFHQTLIKTQNLFNQNRIFDALEKIDELDQIFKDHPAALNIKGACYVNIRAFDKANAIFKQVQAVSPKNTNVLFNLAEVDFVTENWDSAHDRFTKIIPLISSKNKAMTRLCEFKLLLCQLKTSREREARILRDKYSVWDDSPFYYYSRAAILYHEGNQLSAEKMLRNARFVWSNDKALAAWQDTLIEFGYIRSFHRPEAAENIDRS